MAWDNSVNGKRAGSLQLTENVYLVHWHGADYAIQYIKDGQWKIRCRTNGHIHHFQEVDGFGKEEVIEWIERHF